MTAEKIEYGDNGKIAREKINAIIDEVNASIPSIGPNGNWYIGGVDTGITARGFEIVPGDNLLKQDSNGKGYVNLQFQANLTPTSAFNLGVTVGNVSESDGRPKSGVMINAKTNSSYVRMLYSSDGLYLDGGLGVFKRIATTEYVDNALSQLRSDLHRVAFTGKSSDLNNDYGFSAVPILTQEQYDEIPGTAADDKEYFLYENINS